MSEVLSTFRLHPGDPAPDFVLPDPQGQLHPLGSLAGPAGTLVVFACNHCPFVVHLADVLGDLAREISTRGVATIAINPNDPSLHPEDSAVHMPEFAAAHRWEFPYLIDPTQDTAIAYGAACTPDFFLFDADRKLFYTGQFDYSRPRSGVSPTGGDLREAIRRMLSGEAPLPRPYPSSGCNIKWLPGKQPDWWNSGT
jgi:peroxiredoxin